ncbi:MAG: anti-sigma factor antagonist [Terriglobia bacterium]|jgi:anti-anti-sigma factor
MALDIQSAVDAKTARIALAGELDGSSAPALRETVDRVLGGKPAQLVLQVEKLSFMASAGLRILIFAKQKQPGLKIYLVKPQPGIVDTLHKTGFYDGVYITDDEPALA